MGRMSELHIELQERFVHELDMVENGEKSVLDTTIQFRKEKEFYDQMISEIKSFENDYKDQIQKEAEQHGNSYKGAQFEFRSGGKTFDYKGIPEVDELEKSLNEIKAKYKAAYENVQKGLLAVSEDGEELKLPKPKYRKGSMIVKLPK